MNTKAGLQGYQHASAWQAAALATTMHQVLHPSNHEILTQSWRKPEAVTNLI